MNIKATRCQTSAVRYRPTTSYRLERSGRVGQSHRFKSATLSCLGPRSKRKGKRSQREGSSQQVISGAGKPPGLQHLSSHFNSLPLVPGRGALIETKEKKSLRDNNAGSNNGSTAAECIWPRSEPRKRFGTSLLCFHCSAVLLVNWWQRSVTEDKDGSLRESSAHQRRRDREILLVRLLYRKCSAVEMR